MNGDRPTPPRGVPTLTEVVNWPDQALPQEMPVEPVAVYQPAPSGPLPSEQQLIQDVMAGLQRQIDLMLDYRLRETLAPLLARAADSLVRDTRHELALTLREVVERAVAQELARHRTR